MNLEKMAQELLCRMTREGAPYSEAVRVLWQKELMITALQTVADEAKEAEYIEKVDYEGRYLQICDAVDAFDISKKLRSQCGDMGAAQEQFKKQIIGVLCLLGGEILTHGRQAYVKECCECNKDTGHDETFCSECYEQQAEKIRVLEDWIVGWGTANDWSNDNDYCMCGQKLGVDKVCEEVDCLRGQIQKARAADGDKKAPPQ